MIKAVIFDLDGVIVSTDENHYQAWEKIALEEGISFNRKMNEKFRGVSRRDCLDLLLQQTDKTYTESEKEELAERKNNYYCLSLGELDKNSILTNVLNIMEGLKERKIKLAIGSSSRNTPLILKQIGLDTFFDVVVDGNQIKNSKPDPEVFLLAARKLSVSPVDCLVIEDADAGILAAKAAGMKALGVASASTNKMADLTAFDLTDLKVEDLINL